eukprot:TRINITY_DN5867_c0_g1_i7.p1 TRINITY_DN5867_c0_g1~~TRINITY_DN5867_c0_g1_i7.p1  ORF type:complete len:100 (+),score=5.70 TRINITY_DN5867_c0_g1_i7:701-1000(+)
MGPTFCGCEFWLNGKNYNVDPPHVYQVYGTWAHLLETKVWDPMLEILTWAHLERNCMGPIFIIVDMGPTLLLVGEFKVGCRSSNQTYRSSRSLKCSWRG